MNKSVSTINSPEFINLQPLDVNPYMSQCEIKVMYVGGNRNGTFMTKEVVTDMAKTLRGAPIVAYYRKDKEDFDDHGERVTIDSDGIRFECLTKPYGFVAPDAKVWFQKFIDTNQFGEETEREYLMTTGYLWTGQFEECKSAIEGEGKPHSMEIADVSGAWERNSAGMEFFIINDATFSKLCILGSDVEPCFEGSSIKAPEVSKSFAKVDDDFKQTLFSMMQDLKFALEGGQHMDNVENTPVVEEVVETPEVTEPVVEEVPAVSESEEAPAPTPEEPAVAPEAPAETEFKKNEEEEEKKDDEDKGEDKGGEPAPEEEEDEDKKKFAALESEHAELQASYTALEEKYNELESKFTALEASHEELVKFKAEVDDAAKDAMIQKFSMLPDEDEDKQGIIKNKAQYSIQEIEEKLAVICYRKKINFDVETTSKIDTKTEAPVVTFSLGESGGTSVPAWISAVEDYKKNN